MRLVKILLGLAFILLLLLFLLKNNDMANVDLVVKSYENVHLSIIMLGAIAAGIIIGYGVAIASLISLKTENRVLVRKIKDLSEELSDLRNVAIDEGIYDINGDEE
ncbi:MAG: lipopolysaccharide assembly protein LapA domain-containing protein [Fidelibacterota bacterium]